jgi:hypothetical protein
MSNAYVIFDSETMKPVSISWVKSANNFIEISKDFATDFLLGKEKLSEYMILETVDGKSLNKHQIRPTEYQKFSNLKSICDTVDNFDVKICDNFIEIKISPSNYNYILYACLKNDPSWLIKHWTFSYESMENDTVQLFLPNAANYTYFVRLIG